MAEFETRRDRLHAETTATDATRDKLIAAREEDKRLRKRIAGLSRRSGQDDRAAALEQEAKSVRQRIAVLGEELASAKARLAEAASAFATFADPTKAIGRMDDGIPIALFPVRLETRFKTVGHSRRLWVRVYPDDILVDSFQPEVSEAEYANTTLYWANLWRAGQTEGGQRAAWAAMVRSHGAGRAKWLIDQIAPTNPADAPPLPGPGIQLLILRASVMPPDPEKDAIATYWTRLWSTAGAEADLALADLAAALGVERAAEVAADEPVGLRDATRKAGPGRTPQLVFLVLPPHDTQPSSEGDWVRGARAWLLPERFVLMGYRDGDEVLRRIGNPIPPELQIGPDPSAPEEAQLKGGEDITIPPELAWTEDFGVAVAQGMAFDIDLDKANLAPRFDRLLVVGLRINADAERGAAQLDTLIAHHQRSRRGLSILPQGRPTNNTDEESAGWSWWEDPAESFAHFFGPRPESGSGWRERCDGDWLAGLLGTDPKVLAASPHFHGRDQSEARAMNEVLWPGTLGYYMEQMLEPVFTDADRLRTRDFFTRFVIGRSTAPLIRIGRQPYAILPATRWSEVGWWRDAAYERVASKLGLPEISYVDNLSQVIARAGRVWSSIGERSPHVGDPGPDPQQGLLDILGLHPASVRFFHRYSQSFTQYFNLLGFAEEPVGAPVNVSAGHYVRAGLLALAELGWTMPPRSELPEVLEKILQQTAFAIPPPLGADALSETETLSVEREDGQNYLEWLKTAAETSHDTLRRQAGFPDAPPRALLYHLIRHALDLGYVDTALRLRGEALFLSDEVRRAERREPKFLDISQERNSESRWAHLYRADPMITGDQTTRLGDFIPTIIQTRSPYLAVQLDALGRLAGIPTARLERALVEHLDCLSYRLDAWRMGLQAVQLSAMRLERADKASGPEFGRGGLYVGAYGWLTDVKPKAEEITEVALDSRLDEVFADPDNRPLLASDRNLGHIHAPSLDQAVTAAILRNGYEAHRGTPAGEALAVDLSSERVRLGQRALEGVRNGQPLGALMGYQLERALHDEPGLFLDRLIYDLREKFPLAGNRNRTTAAPGASITEVEARNVIDGDAFAEHIAETGADTYPYGLSGMPPLSDFTGPGLPDAVQIGALIDGHVRQMRSIGDAVGDIAMAESVYQIVRGNPERAAGMLDAVSKGTLPPDPEVIATPRSGRTLTHRMSLHLAGGMVPDDAASGRPRARGEPALAAWISDMLPPLATVTARVSWADPDGVTDGALEPTVAELGLDAADLFYLIGSAGAAEMPGIDALLIDHALATGLPRDDAVFEVAYLPQGAAGLTLFELAPLIRALRGLALGARPLRATDLAMTAEAREGEDAALLPRADKIEAVRDDLASTRGAVQAFVAALDSAVGAAIDQPAAADAARDGIDGWIEAFALLARAAEPFSLASATLEVAAQVRAAPFAATLRLIDARLGDWDRKAQDFDRVSTDYANLPVTADDAEREKLLRQAGQSVAAAPLLPAGGGIAALEAALAAARAAFDAERAALVSLRANARRAGATLAAITAELPNIRPLDAAPLALEPIRQQVLAIARELLQRAAALDAEIGARLDAADAALNRARGLVGDAAQQAVSEAAEALLGKGFIVLPEFTLSAERREEWQTAWANRGAMLAHLRAGPEASIAPVEDWLAGVALVRERPAHLRTAVLLAEALGSSGNAVPEPVQFPARAGEGWVGLRFPETDADGNPFTLAEDKLLYDPVFAAGGQIDPGQPDLSYTGLLFDEWAEVIPGEEETTGVTFHFYRPNSEAPQAVLLVTPPRHRGTWRWDDLVGALDETLDFAKWRAVEPADLGRTALGPLLPATLASVTTYPITAALNFGVTVGITAILEATQDE